MKNLKIWLKEERGRSAALAQHLGLSEGRITQIANSGVPDKYKLQISSFTGGEVSIESLVKQRTEAHGNTELRETLGVGRKDSE